MNDYGVHPFPPLSQRWFYGDFLFLAEPTISDLMIEDRTIVITGAGRAFSSGADLKAGFDPTPAGRPDVHTALTERYHPIITGIRAGGLYHHGGQLEFAKGKLGKYKYPREVRIIENVPLTPVFKIDRKQLRTLL